MKKVTRNSNPVKDHPAGFRTKDDKYICPVETTFDFLKGRWKIKILWVLHHSSVMRFNELRDSLGGISEKVLANQLRELEKTDFVQRKIYPEFPPKVEYELTDFALTFSTILAQIGDWGLEHKDKILEILEKQKK
ncbi:MAG: helix-turn-helix domain-containing protein [Acidobacteriota bacterium]